MRRVAIGTARPATPFDPWEVTVAGLDVITRPDDDVGDEFSLSLSFDSSHFVIELYGELDMAGAPELDAAIVQAEETSATMIIVDLSALRFIDSSGLRVLLTASRRSSSGSNRLHFLRGIGQVEKAFALCGLDRRLPFLD
jgi:anti-sigma B factor antagonist